MTSVLFTLGRYGAEMSVEEIGPNKTRLINRAYQETKWCSPLLCLPCPCCCLCWNAVGNSFLAKDVDDLEKLSLIHI